jgi:hypothetical protein
MIYDIKSEEIKHIEKKTNKIEELEEGYNYASLFPY